MKRCFHLEPFPNPVTLRHTVTRDPDDADDDGDDDGDGDGDGDCDGTWKLADCSLFSWNFDSKVGLVRIATICASRALAYLNTRTRNTLRAMINEEVILCLL